MTPDPRPFGIITTESPLEIRPTGRGYHIRDSRKREIWAKITGACGSGSGSGSCQGSPWAGSGSCPTCVYTWVEVTETGQTCDTETLSTCGNLNSFPAYEINGDGTIPVGTIVRLVPSRRGAWYVFQRPGSGGTGFEFAYILDDSPEETDDGVYYNAVLPQWDDGTQDWEDPDDVADHVWVITRVNQPLAKGDVIVVRPVGSANPNSTEERDLYAGIKTRLVDPVTIQDSTSVDAFGNHYWPGRVQYWDNALQERKEGREIWVIDWLNDPKAFRSGDHILAYWIGDAEPGDWVDNFTGYSGSGDGSGSGSDTEHAGPKPLYMTFCSGINTRFLRCFENNVLARNGTIANVGGRVLFLDENCEEDSTLEGICADE